MSQTDFLSNTFNMAANLRASLPQHLDSLIVLVNGCPEPVYISPDIVEELSHNAVFIQRAMEQAFPEGKANAGMATKTYIEGKYLNLLVLKELEADDIREKYPISVLPVFNSFVFDHEMGHLLLDNGFLADEHLSESAADAYAVLRHIQRYGADTEFLRYYNRADMVVFGSSPVHCTDMVVARAKEIAAERDVSALSLIETVRLADQIATESNVSEDLLWSMSAAYKSAAAAKAQKEPQEEIYKKIISVMAANRDSFSDVFYVGRHFFRHPDRKAFLQERAAVEPVWREALNFVETGNMPASGRLQLLSAPSKTKLFRRPQLAH